MAEGHYSRSAKVERIWSVLTGSSGPGGRRTTANEESRPRVRVYGSRALRAHGSRAKGRARSSAPGKMGRGFA